MRFSIALLATLVAVSAAPIAKRQGAGVGAGCDAIFSDTDTMIGESVRGQGKNIANAIPGNAKRQGAGVGAGCDAIFSDTDTMIGESVRGQGTNIADAIKGGAGARRQLNGIADGVTAPLKDFSETQGLGDNEDSFLNTVDGQGTDDAAEFGTDVGDEELTLGDEIGGQNGQSGGSTAPPAGPAGPAGPGHKRQLNGIADGVTAPFKDFAATQATAGSLDSQLNTLDGEGTDGSAQLGETIGEQELAVGQAVGGANGESGGSAPPAGPGGPGH